MRLVIALGGNALLKRGEPLESENLIKNVKIAAKQLAEMAEKHEVLIVHGNGPQVGLLALQSDAYKKVHPYPLDILDAESQGMIGYLLQAEMSNAMQNKKAVTLLTRVLVNENDPAFNDPTKYIGPIYDLNQSTALAKAHHWQFKKDGDYYRRVVPSPAPQKICEWEAIETLLKNNWLVIAGGGGGIPCIKKQKELIGVEAVIDKDLTAALLATQLKADAFIILTDVDGVYKNWDTPQQALLKNTSVSELSQYTFPSGSMGPKVEAVCQFIKKTGKPAMIGNLNQLADIINQTKGTRVAS